MTIDAWLEHATADAAARGLPELRPLLDVAAKAIATLRAADWNEQVDRRPGLDVVSVEQPPATTPR